MPSDTLTLALNGDVSFEAYADAIARFRALIDALSEELGVADQVEWMVHALQVSSAIATIRGESEFSEHVERVVRAYASVGKALERGERPQFSPEVIRNAQGIARVLSDKITSIRFETAEEDAIVSQQGVVSAENALQTAYGAAEGRVQTLTTRKGLRFTLYDTLHDRAVSCYLQEGQEELMREAWDRRAIVEGLISRDRLSGRPVAVRRISEIRVLPVIEPGSYLKARGVAPIKAGEPLPEEIIRRLRNA
jgi:hypothetical protein